MLASTSSVAQIIELAVAPVFLLAAIAGFLSVMSGRLGRIIDRARVMRQRINATDDVQLRETSNREYVMLVQRSKTINRAIGLCISSALIICSIIASLFMQNIFGLHADEWIAAFFVLALLLLILALVLFLHEIRLATKTLEITYE